MLLLSGWCILLVWVHYGQFARKDRHYRHKAPPFYLRKGLLLGVVLLRSSRPLPNICTRAYEKHSPDAEGRNGGIRCVVA